MRNAHPQAAWILPLAVLLLLGSVPARGQTALHAEALLAQGSEHYARGDLKGARTVYAQAVAAHPGHFVALHRLSRVESMLSEDASGEEARTLVASAIEHARQAVKIAPDSAAGHLELAVALGRQALKEGPKTQLSLSREIKSEVDRALALDPGLGRGWHVLALWNRKLASLNMLERTVARTVLGGIPQGASMENALADLKKAVELEPAYVNHHLELGRTYLQLKRKAEAIHELERAVNLPPTGSPLDPRYQAEARELLARTRKG